MLNLTKLAVCASRFFASMSYALNKFLLLDIDVSFFILALSIDL